MSVAYGSSKIIPAPFCRIQKILQKNAAQEWIGSIYQITLTGKLFAYKGSPKSDKTFWTAAGYPPDEVIGATDTFAAILRKQEALRILFAIEGQTLIIQPDDGNPPITCNPRVVSISFPEGGWYQVCNYEIVLETDVLYISGTSADEDTGDPANFKIADCSEEWRLEPADDRFIRSRLTHTLSAKGKRWYNSSGQLTQDAWKNARDYVLQKLTLGIDTSKLTASQVGGVATASAYNYTRIEDENIRAGTYSMTEVWLCYDPQGGAAAIDEYVVDVKTDAQGLVTAIINGTIEGLQISNNTTQAVTSTKITNAIAKWSQVQPTLFGRIQSYVGNGVLNPVVLDQSVVREIQAGRINYSQKYDGRPSTSINGAISEVQNVVFVNPSEIVAVIPVLGRAAGSIIQDIGTTTNSYKEWSIEALMPKNVYNAVNITKPNTDALAASFYPAGANFFYKIQDEENFTPNNGRYTRRVRWIFG